MEDFQDNSVVDASVDAGNEASELSQEPSSAGETVVTEAVDAPKPDANVGEAIRREVERREAQLKKQYEEQYTPYKQQSEQLKRAARLNGWGDDVDGYVARLDEIEQQEQYEREASRMGIDPETYSQYFAPVTSELQQLRQRLQGFEEAQTQQQRQQQLQADWGELYKEFPALAESSQAFSEGGAPDWYNDQMQELMGMGYKPVHAYQLANRESILRQKEQDVLAQVTGRSERQILPSNDRPNNVQFDPANMSFEQIQELSARARRGERITFE
jgi:hypothetical protein